MPQQLIRKPAISCWHRFNLKKIADRSTRGLVGTLLLIALASTAYADDVWSTAVAERSSDGRKIIYRFINKLESPSQKLNFPLAITVLWKYDGPNGLPEPSNTNTIDAIYKLEDLLQQKIESQDEGKLVFVCTGNNERRWMYYVKSEAFFRETLAELKAVVQLELQVSSAADPDWKKLDTFKDSVRRMPLKQVTENKGN